ncbi:MAG: ATP-binding cassette domain-containing protein, partial [Actinomycetota bacterium]
ERALLRMRARDVGMVLQTPARNLLPYASARANVAFAQRFTRVSRRDRRAEVGDLLESVGLGDYSDRLARVMSGGQQQRLALAVALAGRPALLLADEPTSQLDRDTGDAVIALMLATREHHGTALVVVTHDHHVSDALDVEYAIHDGTLVAGSRLASSAARVHDDLDDGTTEDMTKSIGDIPWAKPS